MTLPELQPAKATTEIRNPKEGASVMKMVQGSFTDMGVSPVEKHLRQRRPMATKQQACPTLEEYRRRLVDCGAPPKTTKAYLYQLHRFSDPVGGSKGIVDLFLDSQALGQALVADRSKKGGKLSKWTLDQRRSAVRSFAKLMAPELKRMTGQQPLKIVNEALRLVAHRVGSRYYLPGGRPRNQGGPAPSSGEVSDIIGDAAQVPGFKGRRNEAFFTILYESGARVNALREVNCSDLFVMPNGTVRLMLNAKGCCQPREVELTSHAARLLFAYMETFNQEAVLHGSLARIDPGEHGHLWRSSWSSQWSYEAVRKTFKRACFSVGTVDYRLHALRRAFASDAAAVLPRDVVALAGGWERKEPMDDCYIHVLKESVAKKLVAARSHAGGDSPEQCESPSFDCPAPARAA